MKHLYLLLFLCSTLIHAQDVTLYEFTSNSNEPTESFPNATTSNVLLSDGATPTFGTAQSTSWTGSGIPYIQSGTGWGESDPANAKYFYFTVEANSGFNMNANNVSFEYRSTAAGPSAITVEVNGEEIATFDVPANTTILFSESISFTDVTEFEVRVKGWVNGSRTTAGTGILRIDDLRLDGNIFATSTVLTSSENVINGLNYIDGSGPSTSQSFLVGGIDLNGGDVTVSLPGSSNFEISNSEAGTYGVGLTLTAFDGIETDVFVRLKEGLAVSDYSDVVTISGGGADAIAVNVSGEVTEDIFLIYEFAGEQLTATQFPENATVSEFQVTGATPTFGSAQAGDWTGSGVPYAQSGQGWTETSSENAKYFFFTLAANSGFEIDITNISFEWRATANGPSAITVEINGVEISTFNAINDVTTLFSAPVSLQNQTEIEVRIKGWLNGSRDNTNGTGILRIDDVRLDGSVEASLSINDFNKNNRITLYPNPAGNGDVTIQTDLTGTKQIEMYDINGRQVLKTSTNNDRINVDNFNAGLYLVRISIDEVSIVSKLIIN